MVTIVFFDSSTTNVRMRTDIAKLPVNGDGTFTVQKLEGVVTAGEVAIFGSINIGKIYTIGEMRTLATTNNLQISMSEESDLNIVALAAPGSFAATVDSATEISLAWTASAGASGYILQRATNSGFTTGLVTTQLAASAVAKAVTGLTTATHYYFRIKAIGVGTTDSPYALDDDTTS